MIIYMVLLAILNYVHYTSSEDVQRKGNCSFDDLIKKEITDIFYFKDVEDNIETIYSDVKALKQIFKCCDLKNTINGSHEESMKTIYDRVINTENKTYNETRSRYNYSQTGIDIPVWYPARRNMARGIGQFMIEEIGKNYGEIEENYNYKYPKTINLSHCMATELGTLLAVPCDEQYGKYTHNLSNKELSYCMENNICCLNPNLATTCLNCLCFEVSNCTRKISSIKNKTLCYEFQLNGFSKTRECKKTFKSCEVFTSTIKTFESNTFKTDINYTPPYYDFENKNNVLVLTFYEHVNLVSTESGKLFCMTDGFENILIKRLEINEVEEYNSLKINYTPGLSGHYWCEAFEIKNLRKIKTNDIWVYIENIYPMEILVRYEQYEDPTLSSIAYKKYILPIEKSYNLKYGNLGVIRLNIKIKWMKTIAINETFEEATYLIHICTKLSVDMHETYYEDLKKKLPAVLEEKHYILKYSELYSSIFCMENSNHQGNLRLTWPKTSIGETVQSKEGCLDGGVITRKCGGDYFGGGRWEEPTKCNFNASFESGITKNLSDVFYSNLSTSEMVYNLMKLSELSKKFQAIDVYLTSSILLKVNAKQADLINITSIVNRIMLIDKNTMTKSQSKYNATDRILYGFDLILNSKKYTQTDLLIEKDNLISFTFDCNRTDYAGLALVRKVDRFLALKLKRNSNIDQITAIYGLEAFNYFPNTLLEHLANSYPKIIINIFLNDVFFDDNQQKSVAINFGILLDDTKRLPEPINLLLKPKISIIKGICGFWNYGFMNSKPIFGHWYISKDAEIYESFHKCEFWHVTHFGLLISDKAIIEDTQLLEIATNIECTLSLLGFFGIFTTALLFKTWRNNSGNRILLHYSFISCLQIVLVYISQIIFKYGTFALCIIIGASLHYTLLSQFCWMFVISYLQYKRHVTVFQGSHKFILIKAFIICYFLPIIPVSLLLIFYMDTYTKGNGGICYPTGYCLLFGILIPIVVVLISNILIFSRIVLELFCLRRNKCIDDDLFLLRLRLVVLMFFMLGITWGLGFAAQIFKSPTLLYAFCSTASLQGFVIFLFFIVFNQNTRLMYIYMYRKYNYT